MTTDRQDILRYLRMGRAAPDAALARRLDDAERAVTAAMRPNACWRSFPVACRASGVTVGPLDFESDALRRALTGCPQAFLFCATLGAGVDALLRRCAQTGAGDQLLADAVATAYVERYCDALMARLSEEAAGAALRPRFSPGYGDLPLAAQRGLLDALDAGRRLGVTLTGALLMVPTKSVSAIVGVTA